MIVKIQRRLFSGGDPGKAYVYDRDRAIQQLVPMEMVQDLFDPGENTVYAFAELEGGRLVISTKLPEQDF